MIKEGLKDQKQPLLSTDTNSMETSGYPSSPAASTPAVGVSSWYSIFPRLGGRRASSSSSSSLSNKKLGGKPEAPAVDVFDDEDGDDEEDDDQEDEEEEEEDDDDDDSDDDDEGDEEEEAEGAKSPLLWSSWPGRTRSKMLNPKPPRRRIVGGVEEGDEEKDDWLEESDTSSTTSSLSPLPGPPPFLLKALSFPKTQQPPLWPVRVVVYCGSILTNLMMGALAPFFTRHASTRYNITPATTGMIFAVFPLVGLITSPAASWLCQSFGRYRVHFLGLFWGCLGTVGFGFSDSVGELEGGGRWWSWSWW